MMMNKKDYLIRKKYTIQKDKTLFKVNLHRQVKIGNISFPSRYIGMRLRLKIEFVKLGTVKING